MAAPAAEHLPALTGLRFFLALWVVLHHLTSPGMMLHQWSTTWPELAQRLAHAGYLAVGSFFVLSGFVLARRYPAKGWTAHALYRYGVSRFARIYPVYALSLVLILPLMILDFRPRWIANYILVLQGWWDKPGVFWNTPAWSLSCEIFFYAAFPVAVLIFRTSNWGGVLALGTTACVLTGVFRGFGMPEDFKPLLHFSDFLIGIVAADVFELISRGNRFHKLGMVFYLPAGTAALYLIANPQLVWMYATLNGLLRPLNAVLLVGLAVGGGFVARLLSAPLPVFLGKSSYSLYILHIPLLWWYNFGTPINPLPAAWSALLYTCLVVIISGAVYHWFEEPANQRFRTYLNQRW